MKRFKLDWSKKIGIHFVLDTNTDERINFYSDVVDKLNELSNENEQLRKIGVMYQGHNPCETCTYCLENKVCCVEPVLICDDAKKNFIQGLCKNHKQFQKSIRRYDDD